MGPDIAFLGGTSGQPVSVSGNAVFAYISGGIFSANISGQPVTISGQPVVISGQPVTISGNAVFIYVSGGSFSTNISGQPVTVSGQPVLIAASPPMLIWQSGTGILFISGVVDQPRFLDHVEYVATSGTTISSELVINHLTANGGTTNLFSVNMLNIFSLVFIPDSDLVLCSGDAVIVGFSNPSGCAFYSQTVYR